jgi:hypothetical protein
MRQLKRSGILLLFAGFVGAFAACESPTLPPIPPEEEDKEPTDPDEGGDQTGFLQLPGARLILA